MECDSVRLDLIIHEPPLPHISRRRKESVPLPRTHLHLKTFVSLDVFLCLNPAKVINTQISHARSSEGPWKDRRQRQIKLCSYANTPGQLNQLTV